VVSSGIEPESRASETLILSIVLRDQIMWKYDNGVNAEMKPPTKFPAKELTEPKHFHISIFLTFPHLLNQPGCIARKDFYGNGQQYYAKKFSDSNQTRRTQYFF
jgi:hypothetical protein